MYIQVGVRLLEAPQGAELIELYNFYAALAAQRSTTL
jgi:hypothetical protein